MSELTAFYLICLGFIGEFWDQICPRELAKRCGEEVKLDVKNKNPGLFLEKPYVEKSSRKVASTACAAAKQGNNDCLRSL